jgi:hypothetical protein
MAAVAFFVAIAGGGAYAAAQIGAADIKNDAVRSNHIRDGEVTSADLAPNAVGTRNVIDGSLFRGAFQGGVLPFPPIAFDTHVNSNVGTSPDIPGIDVQLTCGTPGPGDHVSIQFVASTPQQVYVIGTQAIDRQPPTAARVADSYYALASTADTHSSVYLDAMVQYNPGGKWVHYQIGGTWSGTEQGGCDFGGIYTPPSN